jgi:hypothetical protein
LVRREPPFENVSVSRPPFFLTDRLRDRLERLKRWAIVHHMPLVEHLGQIERSQDRGNLVVIPQSGKQIKLVSRPPVLGQDDRDVDLAGMDLMMIPEERSPLVRAFNLACGTEGSMEFGFAVPDRPRPDDPEERSVVLQPDEAAVYTIVTVRIVSHGES